jgi:hypothetical protein
MEIDVSSAILGLSGLATAIGSVFYNRRQIDDLKKWICLRVPCADRITDALQSKTRQDSP